MRYRRFLSFLVLMIGLLSVPVAGFSLMVLDAPGALNDLRKMTLFFAILTFPIVSLGSVVASFIAIQLEFDSWANWLLAIPLLNLIVAIVATCL